MKHKPILLTKQRKARQVKGREVIGLIGTHHGVGVTYTGLMLAFYFGEELGRKTAFIECNHHHDFSLIQNAYEWNQMDSTGFYFRQITCFPDISIENLNKVYSDDYGSIILDFGTDLAGNKEELLRCSSKVVICGRSEWDRQKLIRFSAALKEMRGYESWLYCVPQANSQTVTRIKNEVKREVFAVPACEEPTRLTCSSIQLFHEML